MGNHLLVVGCGSIGQRHIRNLHSLGIPLAAFDPDQNRLRKVIDEHEVEGFPSLQAALAANPVAVIVCTPPHLHTEIAQQALAADAHLFVEKPLSNTLDGLDSLLAEGERRQRTICIGYNLRFHPGLRRLRELLLDGTIGAPLVIRAEMGQYLPDWRPNDDYRRGYIATEATGGGIILDASHELDYVRWLGGEVKSAYCVSGHISDLEIATEDTAAITMRLTSGGIAEVHLDCIQHGYSRNCKIIGQDGTLYWDYNKGLGMLRKNARNWEEIPLAPDGAEMYLDEMRHFIACVRGECQPLVDGAVGRRVLQIALAAKQSARLGQEVTL